MNIYVGNLSFDETDETLEAVIAVGGEESQLGAGRGLHPPDETAFANHGEVQSARVITDRYSGRSRGFGFVEMPNQDEAEAAIAALNGTELSGRMLTVNESRPREGGGGGGRGDGGGGGGGGGGYGGGCPNGGGPAGRLARNDSELSRAR